MACADRETPLMSNAGSRSISSNIFFNLALAVTIEFITFSFAII